jgi:hypothetical protein
MQTTSPTLSASTLKITVSEKGKSITFDVAIKLPSTSSAPYPAIIAHGVSSIPIPNSRPTITYQNFGMAADNGCGQGKFYYI